MVDGGDVVEGGRDDKLWRRRQIFVEADRQKNVSTSPEAWGSPNQEIT